MSASGGAARRWEELWFEQIPPHSVAVLRMVFGLLVLASVAGLMPVDMFWSVDGLVPRSSDLRRLLVDRGLHFDPGWLFIAGIVVSAAAMTVGYQTRLAVPATFAGLALQKAWNHLPLSSAHVVLLSIVFCLMWTDSGRVLAVDSRRRASRGDTIPAWPLWLIRYQVVVIYASSGLWKLSYPAWRDGTAVYWALSLNAFHRFPFGIPSEAAPLLAVLTWSALLFELLFAVGVYFRRTRMVTLVAGVGLHVGLLVALELGPFSLVMIASYLAFIDPRVVKRLVEAWPACAAASRGPAATDFTCVR